MGQQRVRGGCGLAVLATAVLLTTGCGFGQQPEDGGREPSSSATGSASAVPGVPDPSDDWRPGDVQPAVGPPGIGCDSDQRISPPDGEPGPLPSPDTGIGPRATEAQRTIDATIQAVKAWAEDHEEFQQLWLDPDAGGVVVVGFTGSIDGLQGELEQAVPGGSAAVVQVPYTRAELEGARSIVEALHGDLIDIVAVSVSTGRVDVQLGFSGLIGNDVEAIVADIERDLADHPVCVHAPADVPAPGPQPDGGEGWRLLAAEPGAGADFGTAIAADEATWRALWAEIWQDDAPPVPTVDFDSEVAVWIGDGYGQSCPTIRLDDVVTTPGLINFDIVTLEGPLCTADFNPHAWFVALDRETLPAPPFEVRRFPDEWADRMATVVRADLRPAGAVPDADDVDQGLPGPD